MLSQVSTKAAVVYQTRIMAKELPKESLPNSFHLVAEILDQSGRRIDERKQKINLSRTGKVVMDNLWVSQPSLWSPSHSNLYKLQLKLYYSDLLLDQQTLPIGIRYTRFSADSGFFLNGQNLKIKGVCNHHDLGALGAAVHKDALERRLQILKAMGCNAIRTAHNPPSPELLDLADSLGFLILNEAFDEWIYG